MNNNDINVIKDFINYLNSNNNKYDEVVDGHYNYSKEILEFWEYSQNNNIFLDYNGTEERIYLRNKDVNDMNIEDIRKSLDIIFYGERLAEGNIIHNINNGRLLDLLNKLIEGKNNDNK